MKIYKTWKQIAEVQKKEVYITDTQELLKKVCIPRYSVARERKGLIAEFYKLEDAKKYVKFITKH